MVDIQVIRPNATAGNTGWAIVPSGTAHGVTSDDDDATYVSCSTAGNILNLTGPSHTPPANHERGLVQVGAIANATSAGNLSLGGSVGAAFSGGTFFIATGGMTGYGPGPTPANSAQPAGTQPVAWTIQRSSGALRVAELLMQVWSFAAPTFSAEVHDGAGVNRDAGIITDTSRPLFVFDSPDYDTLVARTWTLEVRTDPGGVVVFTASGTGTPPDVQCDPLPNGDYEADLQIFSTIRANDPYASTVETVTFEVAFVAPAGPVLTLTPILTPPSIEIDWISDTATATAWDADADVVTEIRRTDCNGTRTFYVEQTGIGADSFIDRFMSLSYNGVFCDEADHTCQVCYDARYWGEVDSVLIATDWSTAECDSVPNPTPGNAWMRGADSGDASVCPEESFDHVRPFGVFQPIAGGIPTVTTATPGGRDYTLDLAVESEAELVILEGILAQPLFFYQPVEQADLWLAPANQNMRVVKVKRIRTVSVPCVAVNPQPVADPASFF